MNARMLAGAALALALVTVAACSGDDGSEAAPAEDTATTIDRTASGGDATVGVAGAGAFEQPVPGLEGEDRRAFAVGNNFFNDNWVTAPASTDGRDGLGPTFNAQSCSSCHFRDGRGQPPVDPDDPERGLLLRISVLDEDGEIVPHPVYGDQLQDRSIEGVPAEGRIHIDLVEQRGSYADGTPYVLQRPEYSVVDTAFGSLDDTVEGTVVLSPRVAPFVFGVGLLEGIPEADVVAGADPDDSDGDGISGRPNRAVDPRTGEEALGRFGWKAQVATVEAQSAGAFLGDIGITTPLSGPENCPPAQTACAAAPDGGTPEVDEHKLDRVTFYTRTLAVPARRAVGEPETDAGEQLFADLGCASCHTPRATTGPSEVAALDRQSIAPYTDLLLHDMGDGLADGRPDGLATGSEWRTPPLWGIGLVETVSGHSRYLHDGRARDLTEAVLWHGGEAQSAQAGFLELSSEDRQALIVFLESL